MLRGEAATGYASYARPPCSSISIVLLSSLLCDMHNAEPNPALALGLDPRRHELLAAATRVLDFFYSAYTGRASKRGCRQTPRITDALRVQVLLLNRPRSRDRSAYEKDDGCNGRIARSRLFYGANA